MFAITTVVIPDLARRREGQTTIRAVGLDQPGSELFVVYNDERDTRVRGFPELSTRAFIVKINRLFRFLNRPQRRGR